MTKVYLMFGYKLPNLGYWRYYFLYWDFEDLDIIATKDYIYLGNVLSTYAKEPVSYTLDLVKEKMKSYLQRCTDIMSKIPHDNDILFESPALQFFSVEDKEDYTFSLGIKQ